MVAQPPFSMTDRRFHDETLLNSTNFAGASAWCWNFSTQIGASTATTAVSARWVAIRSAVLPSVHPSDENPTTATQQRRPLHPIPLVSLRVDLHLVTLAWEKGLLRFQINQEPIARGGPAKIDSETTQTTPALRLSISATVLADQAVGVPCCPEAGKDNHRSIEGA
jgi:hypothetical protein